jgi:hypothetical protein
MCFFLSSPLIVRTNQASGIWLAFWSGSQLCGQRSFENFAFALARKRCSSSIRTGKMGRVSRRQWLHLRRWTRCVCARTRTSIAPKRHVCARNSRGLTWLRLERASPVERPYSNCFRKAANCCFRSAMSLRSSAISEDKRENPSIFSRSSAAGTSRPAVEVTGFASPDNKWM